MVNELLQSGGASLTRPQGSQRRRMNIRGVIETVQPRQIRGWAYDEDAPRIHVSIVAAVMGIDVATGEASLFRKDLAEAGVGDGDHSFVLDFDPPLRLAAIGRPQIYAIGRDG